jgi:hypothetical protein
MEYDFSYKVQSYLQLNNLSGQQPDDYLIVYDQEDGTPSLSVWDIEKLGDEPSDIQLTAAVNQLHTNRLAIGYKLKAAKLLSDTDWTQYSDVNNTLVTPHLLNQEEFNTYRLALRAIVVSPSATSEFPTPPNAQWSS